MRLIRGLHNLRTADYGCVATIGNFDGVHLGHRAVFKRLLARGRELGLPATVITFEPQPLEFFNPTAAPARLTRLREKLAAIHANGIDRVMLLEFNPKLATLPAQNFVQQLLIDGLGVRFLLVGDDFRFGYQRRGDFALLQTVGAAANFAVENLHTVTHNNARISSTRVREALALGDFAQAQHLLGRAYQISGRVAYGEQRGRTIGFPTINIHLHRRFSPLRGVYAVVVHGLGEQPHSGVANIGNRPTISGRDDRLEVHLFDFDEQLYGRHLAVEFRHKLRDEQRFDSFDALKQQIQQDAANARAFLKRDCDQIKGIL
ncbi:riboflavin biosynthesis protein RibF [Chromatium weissei]|nr:riboflavin biosynthesis protein RibF [Chromatium weissei]